MLFMLLFSSGGKNMLGGGGRGGNMLGIKMIVKVEQESIYMYPRRLNLNINNHVSIIEKSYTCIYIHVYIIMWTQ